jgi:uncharacterized membrane protein
MGILAMKSTFASWVVSYGATAAVMLIIDMIWLGVIAKPWYLEGMGHLMAARPNLIAAAFFYAMFPVGLMMFAVIPHAEAAGIAKAALWGAAFGFFTYATYDLTNLATLKAYPLGLAVLDITWGTFVSAIAAAAGKAALNATQTGAN